MTEHTGRRRSPGSFANTVASHSKPRRASCRTTVNQNVESQLGLPDWSTLTRMGRPPSLNSAMQMAAAGMAMSAVMNALKPKQELPQMTELQLAVMRLLTNPNPMWRTSDGRRIPIRELTGNHLENIISYMYRRQADIDLVGDDRPLEKQLITQIWFYKLQGEQKRRDDILREESVDDFLPDDEPSDDGFYDSLGDWPEDW